MLNERKYKRLYLIFLYEILEKLKVDWLEFMEGN